MKELIYFIQEYIYIPIAHAQAAPAGVSELVQRISRYFLNPLIVLMFTIALVTFIWGMFTFFGRKDNTDEIEKGKRHILWGVIGMAIMISVFGLIDFISGTTIGKTVSPEANSDVSNLFIKK